MLSFYKHINFWKQDRENLKLIQLWKWYICLVLLVIYNISKRFETDIIRLKDMHLLTILPNLSHENLTFL